MALPDAVMRAALREVAACCDRRVPEDAQVTVEVRARGDALTVFERTPPWPAGGGEEWVESKVAQLRRDKRARTWELFAYDWRGRRVAYPLLAPGRDLEPLLDELESDPICMFWRSLPVKAAQRASS